MKTLLICEDNGTTARRMVSELGPLADRVTVVVARTKEEALHQIELRSCDTIIVSLDSSMPVSATDRRFDNRAGAQIGEAIFARHSDWPVLWHSDATLPNELAKLGVQVVRRTAVPRTVANICDQVVDTAIGCAADGPLPKSEFVDNDWSRRCHEEFNHDWFSQFISALWKADGLMEGALEDTAFEREFPAAVLPRWEQNRGFIRGLLEEAENMLRAAPTAIQDDANEPRESAQRSPHRCSRAIRCWERVDRNYELLKLALSASKFGDGGAEIHNRLRELLSSCDELSEAVSRMPRAFVD